MKKKIIAVMAIVMFVLVMPFSANLQNISANQTRAISYASPSITANKHTGSIGDVIDSTISGLSYDKIEEINSSEHFDNVNYTVYGQSGFYNLEFLNRMLAFEGLEVGGATAKNASGNAIDVEIVVAVKFNTYPSTSTSMTLYNFKVVVQPANQKTKISISKQELEEFSKTLGYTLENLAEIKVTYKNPTNIKMAAMSIDDSVYKTSIVNGMQVTRSTDTYARVNLRAWATGNNYHQTASEFKADYVRFNTLDMEVTCNKDSFIPGEQITMTWTLTNTSSYNNSFVYMGMDYGKTGLIEVPNQNDTSTITHTDWAANPNDELYIAFIDNNVTPRKWQVFQSGGVYKISKTFQVNEDFLEDKISFDNFTMINNDYANRKIVPFTLMLKNYTIQFETNGGNIIAPTQVYHGRKLTQPVTPVKKGYTFEGWYQDKELMIPWSFDDIVNEDKTLYAKWKLEDKVYDVIDFNDFEHYNKDGELTIDDIFNKGNVTIKDSNGNMIHNSDLKYDQNEIDTLNDAIKKNEAGIYSITFTTPLGSEFTIKITTIKYTSTIIVETDKNESSGNGMHKNNMINTYDNSNTTNALMLLGISGLALGILYTRKKVINKV